MQTVAETPTFTRQADRLSSESERRELIDYLANHPMAGDERGGARVVYFYGGEDMPVYALLAYAKSAKTDLNPSERRAVRTIVAAIKSAGKEKR